MDNIWLVEPTYLVDYLERRENISQEQIESAKAFFDDPSSPDGEAPKILKIEGDVGTIEISGILSRSGPDWIDRLFGDTRTSTNQIVECLEICNRKDNIKVVYLDMNTPGGTVDGTDQVFQAIIAAKNNKPIIAKNHGMIASAGYWIASAASKIVAMTPSAETGSIGVVVVGFDFSEMRKDVGIKRVKIISRNAPEKAPDVESKKGIANIQKRIDAIENVFFQRVAEGRKITIDHIKENFGKGGVLIAQEALQVNMIDTINGNVSMAHSATSSGGTAIDAKETLEEKTIKMEVKKMGLKDLMASDFALRAEVYAKEKEDFNRGVQSATDRHSKLMAKVVPYLSGEKSYPKAITALASKVLTGESSIDAFEGAVTVLDAQAEQANADLAAKETDRQGETKPDAQQQSVTSQNGQINSEADLEAEAKSIREGI